MRNTRLATAIHEAGHAVAQLAMPPAPWIDSIELFEPGAELLGIVNTQSVWQPYMAEGIMSAEAREAMRALAWKDILIYLAGPIAELRWRRHSRIGIAFGATEFADRCVGEEPPPPGTDLGRARARLAWAHAGDEHGSFVRAWLETEELIGRHWRSVQTIGRTLLQRGRLEDEELLAIWATGK